MRLVTGPWIWLWVSLAVIFACSNQSAWSQNAAVTRFSAQPSSAEISNARIFDEPLIPMGGEPSIEENLALADALTTYANRTNFDDFTSITGFLDRFPDSKWSGSLLLHLGTEYYNSGYYSRAMTTWEAAWQRCKNINAGPGKAQADRALGELARMYSKLGRLSELTTLLQSTKDRDLEGPATRMVMTAKDSVWMMQNHPEFSFRCGPLALDRILLSQNSTKAEDPLFLKAYSTTNGYSLSQLARLSLDLGMNYQMAFRSSGAPFILLAVVHWKSGHYAAFLKRDQDRLLTQDYTFQDSHWFSLMAVEDESSGYFLVPPGPLPAGWRLVSDEEAQHVWGKGVANGPSPGGPGPGPTEPPPGCQQGMTVYSMDVNFISLKLQDTPVGYQPPVGPPVRFTATYNQGEPNQPATFYYSNLGPKWTCTWVSYITDNPTSPNADVSYYLSGGGTLYFTGFNTTNQSYLPELLTQALLIKTSTNSYEMQFKDGSKREFAMSDGSVGTTRRIFLTQILDPSGNSVRLRYNANLCVTNIVDAIGHATTLLYTNQVYSNAVTSVIDPFGRAAYFQYNTNGLLSSITDALALQSKFAYGANQFVNSLITPYGTNTFITGSSWNWLQATDPLGQSEYLEFNQSLLPNDPAAKVPHGIGTLDNYLVYRNSIYWNKKAYAEGAGDYTKAKIYHFCHLNSSTTESQILESVKPALENRTWYNYPGQVTPIFTSGVIMNQPTVTGRVLDDGTSQLYYNAYNSMGNMTNSIDPVGRTFSYIYATNNVDLLQKVMTHNGKNEVQSTIAYDSQHHPLTITDAAGQTTTNTYNSRGQLFTTANQKNELTIYNYDANGYLTNIVGHLQNSNDVTSFTYDSFGRVHTMTDTEGYTLTYTYDAFDRKTSVTHPDGTFEQFVYSNLDLVASGDRLGRWTTNTFDALRHLVKTRDPLGRVTQYEWCKCGAMTGLIDPMGRTTTWDYDVQSRLTAKHYVDGSTITYTYENTTSRLKSRRDEKGQDTVYEYYPDNNLKRVSYPNAIVPTPTVTYTYDPDYNRVLTMQDGIGTMT